MEDFVTYEQAVLLKELGFDLETDYVLYVSGDFKKLVSNDEFYGNGLNKLCDEYYYVPSLYEAQKWLFGKFGLWIQIERNSIESTMFNCEINHADEIYQKRVGIFENPFDALSEGINEAINLLKEKRK